MELAQKETAQAQPPKNSEELLEVALGLLKQVIHDVERMLAVRAAKIAGNGSEFFADENAIKSIKSGQENLKVLLAAQQEVQELREKYSSSSAQTFNPIQSTAVAAQT